MENYVSSSSELQKNQSEAGFFPPRHWVGTEELNADYWSDPTIQTQRGQEFHDKPVETIDLIDRMDKSGMVRRDFLTIMGASMAMASMSCARRPVHKIIPYVVKPEELTPGVPNFYATTCPETGMGLLVKTREGRPIKLEGNPDHPMNAGRLNARAQAAILDLYDTDRLKVPVQRDRNGASGRAISWVDADQAISAKLKTASKVRILSGAVLGDSTRRLINEFLGAFDSGSHVEFEPLSLEEISDSQAECYGSSVLPHYLFDQAEVVLSLGADFMSHWVSPVEHSKDWSAQRKLDAKDPQKVKMSRFYCFESTMTLTGANADERYAVRPGDELKVAMAIAHELIITQGRSRHSGDGAVKSALETYKPASVAAEIGLENGEEKFKAIAQALWEARGKSLVVAGGLHSKTETSLALQIATNFLNSTLENDGATVDGNTGAYAHPQPGFAGIEKLVGEMQGGGIEVLILYRTNPAFALAKGLGLAEGMKKVPLVIAISDREDETAQMADYVLPDHHYLENWGDAHPRKGIYSLQQPTISPIHATRAFQDSLLSWIHVGGLRTQGLAAKIASATPESNTWHDYLKEQWKETVFREAGPSGSFEQFWEGALREGVLVIQTPARGTARSFRVNALGLIPKYSVAPAGVKLALVASSTMLDGRFANNAWLQELPDPVSTVTWDNCLNVSPALANQLGVKLNDVVEVSSGDVSVQLPVYVQPGMHPSVVSVAVGYGRRAAGKVGDGVGLDVYPFVGARDHRLVFSGQTVQVRKTGKLYQLATTQWHNVSENRPIINDITLDEFRKNPGASMETNPELRMETVPSMWPVHEYKGYRWGMAIDLTSCIGCGACTLACQAENNIPVVGRNNVRVSRQMHWIRIDRYYMGNADNPDVVFQPMLCQHCENAPCETVCPVLATVHDDEGLNNQVYNRCVGTRYCQNNCPYKVRRFNFFDHWKSYEGTMNLAWNPDVTVRTRGIMEKCTFCIQRIQSARDHAKDLGEKIKDGDIKTACQQTCPTEAIEFGDMNDPNSRVSKLRVQQRAFRVLETLNTKPSIAYLTKVRNKEGVEPHGHH